jgi:hypothetical protein
MIIDLKIAFEDIKNLVLQGKTTEVFDKYYADAIVMQENENPPTIGKAENLQREHDFFSKVIEFRRLEVKNVAFGENVIMSEWFLDYTHQEWGKRTYHQASVQQWKDGKVIHERFYYGS